MTTEDQISITNQKIANYKIKLKENPSKKRVYKLKIKLLKTVRRYLKGELKKCVKEN